MLLPGLMLLLISRLLCERALYDMLMLIAFCRHFDAATLPLTLRQRYATLTRHIDVGYMSPRRPQHTNSMPPLLIFIRWRQAAGAAITLRH